MSLNHSILLTDLYQLTMAAGYWEKKFDFISTFELFVRKLPDNRSYLVAAGIDQCLDYLLNLKFTDEEIDFLRNHDSFKYVSSGFFNYLKDFRFTGDVWAIEEGSVFFPGEPVIRITAPTIQAQIVETYLLSMFNFQTLIASKAARITQMAGESQVIEFGTRRAHSPEAGLLAARAAYIGGCVGTSNVLAGLKYGIPVSGTMAHSWVMAFDSEKQAYKDYSQVFPDSNVLLIDTYDTVSAAKIVSEFDFDIKGVRLDSGDLEKLSKSVRKILDDSGKEHIKILASSDLNEYSIKKLMNNKSPIDIFGVGTELSTSKDSPALSGVYKLVQQEKDNRVFYKAKFSENKKSYPAKKQVYRFINTEGNFKYDIVALDGEFDNENVIKLLKPAIIAGKICDNYMSDLNQAQKKCINSLEKLPEELKNIDRVVIYPVKISEKLEDLANQVMNQNKMFV